MAYTHILATTDLSESANHALCHAFEEAEKHGAPLTLLHVLPPHGTTDVYYVKGAPDVQTGSHGALIGMPIGFDPDTGGTLPMPKASAPQMVRYDHVEEARSKLRELIPETFKGKWEVKVAMGKTAEIILQTAQDQNVDLIVMGTHGRTGLRHTLFGSVAEAVMHRARCPVLMIRYGTETPVPS